jgi:lipoprotein-anchoring transpeptidase ErfK/SrfK
VSAVALVGLLALLASALTGCGDARADVADPGVVGAAPAPVLVPSASSGASGVGVASPLTVTSVGGTLSTVAATGPGNRPLGGQFNADHTRWTSAPLDFDSAYTVTAEGRGVDGRPATPLASTFRTVAPRRTLSVESVRPANGQVVGVAMPVSVYFTRAVPDRAAVERTLRVQAGTPTTGSFHWVSDSQVNWRPEQFWAPHTTVTVQAALHGVDLGRGTFGGADFASGFSTGVARSAVGDAAKHTFTLFEDGTPVRTFPASFGRAQYPTQYGMHVAFEKHLSKRMRSDSWGGPKEGEPGFYDEVLPLAVRISGNGEFVHVNTATTRQQGRSNVSHGCVNLSAANGRFFYDWVQIGDPVNIVNSGRPLTPADGDISDWLLPFDQYRAGSSLLTGVTDSAPGPHVAE